MAFNFGYLQRYTGYLFDFSVQSSCLNQYEHVILNELKHSVIGIILNVARLKIFVWPQKDSQNLALWLVRSPVVQGRPTKLNKW